MKFKRSTFLFGSTMALAGFAAGMVMTFTPPPVGAQMFEGFGGRPPIFDELNLTPEQEAQLSQIREDSRSQIESLLTPAQQEQFQIVVESAEQMRQAMSALNLTEEQRDDIRGIMRSARDQGADVLTEEQRAQLRETLRDHHGNRHGDRDGGRGGFRRDRNPGL